MNRCPARSQDEPHPPGGTGIPAGPSPEPAGHVPAPKAGGSPKHRRIPTITGNAQRAMQTTRPDHHGPYLANLQIRPPAQDQHPRSPRLLRHQHRLTIATQQTDQPRPEHPLLITNTDPGRQVERTGVDHHPPHRSPEKQHAPPPSRHPRGKHNHHPQRGIPRFGRHHARRRQPAQTSLIHDTPRDKPGRAPAPRSNSARHGRAPCSRLQERDKASSVHSTARTKVSSARDTVALPAKATAPRSRAVA